MSILKFNPKAEAIVLDVELEGKIILHTRLVVDTGASLVVIPWRIATALNLKIDPENLIRTTTVSAVESSPLTLISKMTTLGKTAENVLCLVKDLPSEAGVDGLLGLSFLRHFELSLDFKKGILKLE